MELEKSFVNMPKEGLKGNVPSVSFSVWGHPVHNGAWHMDDGHIKLVQL